MNNKKTLIFWISVVVLIILITIITIQIKDKKLDKDSSKYLELIDYNKLVELTNNNENFILYVSSSNCSICKSFKPILVEFLKENNIVVKNIDTSKLTNKEKIYINEEIANIKITPTIYFIDEGKSYDSNKISGKADETILYNYFKNNGYIE